MIVKLSEEAQFSIQEYRNSLSEPKYNCSKKRIRKLCKMMIDTVVKKASNSDSLQVCPYKTLGQEKDKEGKPQKQNLRWFQYKSPSSSTWGVSVLCDFENDVATVHRIVHSSFIKESTKWILLEDYKNQIRKENTMKRLNITKESYNKSKYFQNKYGKLEYVSESDKVYKTEKGHLIMFKEGDDEIGVAFKQGIHKCAVEIDNAIKKMLPYYTASSFNSQSDEFKSSFESVMELVPYVKTLLKISGA